MDIWKWLTVLALLAAAACLIVIFAVVMPRAARNEARLQAVYKWHTDAAPWFERTHAKVWAGDGDPPTPPPPPPDWD